MRLAFALAVLAALAGCGRLPFVGGALDRVTNIRGSQTEVDGLRFRSRVGTTDGDRRGFVVTTRGAARSVPAALQAAGLRGREHCLETAGGTDIAWSLDPARPVDAATLSPNGTVTVSGTCVTR